MDHNDNNTETGLCFRTLALRVQNSHERSVAYRSHRSIRRLFAVLLISWLFLGINPVSTTTGLKWRFPQAVAGQLLYVNDAAGRLAAVIDPTSNAAVYQHSTR